jgi:hypothetical protein
MKFFTKEWYADTILADMCFQLKASSKAAKFDEKYFLSLYNGQKKWFVRSKKYIAKHNKTTFDLAAAEAAYEASHQENIAYVKANIPQEILNDVADVRVLALGSATHDVTERIVRFCGQVNQRCERVTAEYEAEVEKLAANIGWVNINLLNKISNSAIELCEGDGNGNFVFATSAEYTGVPCRVDLKNAKVILCDEGLVGASVAHFEILQGDGDSLIFSALCQKIDGSLIEFSAEMSDFEVI